MTHPTEEAGVGGANDSVDAPELSIEDRLLNAFAGEDEEAPEEGQTEAAAAGDEPEIDAEVIEAEAEAESPPIVAPNSFSEEEKAEFAKLPRPMQEALARREADRDRAFHSKTQEAARAKAEAEKLALAKTADVERQALERLDQLATFLLPPQPDENLLYGGPNEQAEFNRQRYMHEKALAQLQQVAAGHLQSIQQAQTELQQRNAEEFRATLTEKFPEYLDPATSPALQKELGSVAQELGYSTALIQQASADDILAMKKAAEWRSKASKYDALMAKQMSKVRAAKQLPKQTRPGVAPAPGATQDAQYQADRKAMRNGDRDAGVRVFSQFL